MTITRSQMIGLRQNQLHRARRGVLSAAGAGGGSLDMITGDGSTYLEASDVTHPTLPSAITISFWCDLETLDAATTFMYALGGITQFDARFLGGVDGYIVNARGAGSVFAIQWQNSSSLDGAGPYHVMVRGNYDPSDDGEGFFDGVSEFTDTTFSGTSFGGWSNTYIGCSTSNSSPLNSNGRFGDLWMGAGDITDPVGVFIDALGNPLPPSDASGTYGGITPWIWFSGLDAFDTGVNAGSGGGTFSKTGSGFALAESIDYA